MTFPNFCILWLSPLSRGPGPLFQQFRIPFTQEWFVPSLIEICQLVLEKKTSFSVQTQVNMVFPKVAPPDPRGPWFEESWLYIISESFRVNMIYSGSVVLEKKIFKWPHHILAFLWLSPLWRESGPLFEQFRIPFTQGWFVLSLIDIGLLVLEKKIFLV
jgi:hypothetical protein